MLLASGRGVDHEVVALLLHSAEASSTKPMDLENDLLSLRVCRQLNIVLLPRPDPIA